MNPKFGEQLCLSYAEYTLGWRAADGGVLLRGGLGRLSFLWDVGAFPDTDFTNRRLLTAGERSNSNNCTRPATTLLFHIISRKAKQRGSSILSLIAQRWRVSLWRFREVALSLRPTSLCNHISAAVLATLDVAPSLGLVISIPES
jgi:hypothetical protein